MINVIGLGYIGLPTALMLAAHPPRWNSFGLVWCKEHYL